MPFFKNYLGQEKSEFISAGKKAKNKI